MGLEADSCPPIGGEMPLLSQPHALSACHPTWQQLLGLKDPQALQTKTGWIFFVADSAERRTPANRPSLAFCRSPPLRLVSYCSGFPEIQHTCFLLRHWESLKAESLLHLSCETTANFSPASLLQSPLVSRRSHGCNYVYWRYSVQGVEHEG